MEYKDIFNVWVGISRNSKINRILLLPTEKEVKEGIINNISKQYESYIKKKKYICEFDKDSLILEKQYFFNFNKINTDNFLCKFNKEIISKVNECSKDHIDILSLKRNKNGILDKKDIIKFLIIETKKQLLFLNINSRNTIKCATILDIITQKKIGGKVGISSNIMDINSGINIPEQIDAVFEKNENCIYVLNIFEFENMLYINELKKEKAKINYNKFINGEYKISSQNWKVEFVDSDKIKCQILNHARDINRLANFENDSIYDIESIKYAVKQLKDKNNRVEFDNKNKKVIVRLNNYKTFIGIIHNSIVERLISKEVEILS